jgi:hypothetical protein
MKRKHKSQQSVDAGEVRVSVVIESGVPLTDDHNERVKKFIVEILSDLLEANDE